MDPKAGPPNPHWSFAATQQLFPNSHFQYQFMFMATHEIVIP